MSYQDASGRSGSWRQTMESPDVQKVHSILLHGFHNSDYVRRELRNYTGMTLWRRKSPRVGIRHMLKKRTFWNIPCFIECCIIQCIVSWKYYLDNVEFWETMRGSLELDNYCAVDVLWKLERENLLSVEAPTVALDLAEKRYLDYIMRDHSGSYKCFAV